MKMRIPIPGPRAMDRAAFERWVGAMDLYRASKLKGEFLDAVVRIERQLADAAPPPTAGPGWRERALRARGVCQARLWTVKKHVRALKRKGAA